MYSSTKASQFTAKINALGELRSRLNDDNPNNENTIKDIIASLKYFESTLLGWIKDSHPCFDIAKCDFNRQKFPLVDYQHLYEILIQLISAVHKYDELIDTVVRTWACTFPFLSYETFMALPTTIAEELYDLPHYLQHRLIDLLCQYVIPIIYSFMTENVQDDMADINLSVPSVLASILDATSDAASWTKIMECFMRFKGNTSTDLLTVLAYGTKESLEASIHLLNRYFPPVDIASTKAYQSPPYENILPFLCQNPQCSSLSKNATMLCLDPAVCSTHLNMVPPMYLCEKCYKSVDRMDSPLFTYVIQPATLVSQVCDNIDCRFGFMKALYFCYSLDCIKKNEYKPIRLCEDCHKRLHLDVDVRHMNHECLKELWITDNPEQSYLVDAIVRLWAEAQPNFQEKCAKMGLVIDLENIDKSQQDPVQYIKKVFGSLHGLWLLKTTCPIPPSRYHLEHLGRLLSMLFVWVESVEYASHPKALQIVEPNRKQAISWINKVQKYDLDMYCSCLLPNPPMHARVGHPWNMLTSVTRKDMEILQRIVTLTKNGLIPELVWDNIMPQWIQEIKSSVPVSDIKQFRTILGELFDMKSEIRPAYALNFIKKHLESSILKQSQEGLVWVQILSYLDVQMEITSLLDMFIEMLISKGESISTVEHTIESVFPFPDKQTLHKVTSTGSLSRHNSAHSVSATSPHNAGLPSLTSVQDDLSITVLILDVLIKQLTLQKSLIGNVYIADKESTSLNLLLVCILDQTFQGDHVTDMNFHCPKCQVMNTIYYLVALLIDLAIQKQVMVDPSKTEYTKSITARRNSSNASRLSVKTPPRLNSVAEKEEEDFPDNHNRSSFITNNTEYDSEEDLAATLDKGEGLPQLATLPSHVTKEQVLRMQRKSVTTDISDSALNVIPELQMLEKLLQELKDCHEATVALHIVISLDVLCIRGECLQMVAQEDMELLNRLQTFMVIPNLWRLLESTNSNLAQSIVPLLLHCVSLPFGAERLCEEMEFDFTREDWKVRFAAVEKIGLVCQFVPKERVYGSGSGMSAIIHGICYLTAAVEDVNVTISTRATSLIQTMKISSLKLIYEFMEEHYRKVVDDRLQLLNAYRTIHMVIPEASPLSGDFFLKMLNLTKRVEDKRKSRQSFDHTVMHSFDINSKLSQNDLVFLPIHTRKLHTNKKMFGYTLGQVPMDVYRMNFTLQVGQTWKNNNASQQEYPNIRTLAKNLSNDIIPGLDTVAEEDEDVYQGVSSLHRTSNVLSEDSHEDEILSYLISLLFDFLSKKMKGKIDKDLGHTDYDHTRRIISFFGHGMGLQRNGVHDWVAHKKMNIRHLRKNGVFVTYLMNLPRLLDGNVERGNCFMHLTLVVMETCVKNQSIDDYNLLSLNRLDPVLLRVWLMSLTIILYKYNIHDNNYQDTLWRLMIIVKNTIAGHSNHYCSSQPVSQHFGVTTLRNVVNVKMKMKTFKNFKRSDKNDRPAKSNAGSRVEMTDFSDIVDAATLERDGTESHVSRISEVVISSDTTEELLSDTNKKVCPKCRIVLFNYEEETINNCIIALLTYIHMDTEQAAPFLIDAICSVALKASVFSPNTDSKIPQLRLTTTASVAQQFLRCVFYKLAPCRLFPELFSVENHDKDFFVIMATILQDFSYMNQLEPIKLILQDVITDETESNYPTIQVLQNLTIYMRHVINNPNNQWNVLRNSLQNLFQNAPSLIPNSVDMDCLLEMMTMLLRCHKNTVKFLLEEMEATLTHVLKYCTFSVRALYHLTTTCYEVFSKDRGLKFTRKISLLLATALSGKASLSEMSLLKLVQFFCNDVGTIFAVNELQVIEPDAVNPSKATKAVDCLDMNYAHEVIEYLKAPCRRLKDGSNNDHERSEQFPTHLKLAISQFLSVYLHRIDPTCESKFYYKLLAVFCIDQNQERLQIQATNLDMQEYTTQFRVYSWILLGAINHSVVMKLPIISLIPLQKAVFISEYIDVVFENIYNESPEDMLKKYKSRAQLHFTFLLMQIWTVYIEMHYYTMQTSWSGNTEPITIIKEFWSKLMPTFYSLLQHSQKLQSECIALFSSLVENIAVHCPQTFSQLYPLWKTLLEMYTNEIPSSMKQRIKDFNNVKKEGKQQQKDLLALWVSDIHKKLWNTERMLKGKTTSNVTV